MARITKQPCPSQPLCVLLTSQAPRGTLAGGSGFNTERHAEGWRERLTVRNRETDLKSDTESERERKWEEAQALHCGVSDDRVVVYGGVGACRITVRESY